jgi:hypothetical protein
MRTAVLSVVLTTLLAGLGLSPTPVDAQDTSRSWSTVKQFEGTGRAETEAFTVEAEEWRLAWTSTSETPGGLGHIVQIYVLRPASKKPRLPAANAVNQETLSDTSATFPGGRYALKINAVNGDWTVTVQTPQ